MAGMAVKMEGDSQITVLEKTTVEFQHFSVARKRSNFVISYPSLV